jgi:hypothetical protein
MDQYPYREDAAGAIGESIQWLRAYEKAVDDNRSEIDILLQEGTAVESSKFLRRLLMGTL